MIFLPKKQRIYGYLSEFASEALHIVIFENFVKSTAPSFCFTFKIPDNLTATTIYGLYVARGGLLVTTKITYCLHFRWIAELFGCFSFWAN